MPEVRSEARKERPVLCSEEAEMLMRLARMHRELEQPELAIADLDYLIELVPAHTDALYLRGWLLGQMNRLEPAIADLRRVTQLIPSYSDAWGNLGWYLLLNGQWGQARAATAEALRLEPDNHAWEINLGHTYLLTGDTDNAYRHYRDAMALLPDQAALDSGLLADLALFIEQGWRVVSSREAQAWAQASFVPYAEAARRSAAGMAARHAGDLIQAKDVFAEAVSMYEDALGGSHPRLAYSLDNLAGCLRDLGDLVAAKTLYERALMIDEAVYGPDHIKVALRLSNLAGVLKDLGDLAMAKRLYERALTVDEADYGPDHQAVATDLNNLALVYQSLRDFSTARRLHERALEIFKRGDDTSKIATATNNLATVLLALGDLNTAKSLFERALTIDLALYGPRHPTVAIRLSNLAEVCQALGDLEAAAALFERALEIDEAVYNDLHPEIAKDLNNLARVYQGRGDLSTARELFERALRIAQATDQPALRWSVQGNLSAMYAEARHSDLAIFYGKQAVNTLQAQRGRLSELDAGLQSGFLASVGVHYKHLSNLLIGQGRLPEAQQVLGMLKEQEFHDFLRRDPGADPRQTQASYNPVEQEQLAVYAAESRALMALVAEQRQFDDLDPFDLTPAQEARRQALTAELTAAYQRFQQTLDQIKGAFAALSVERQTELAKKQLLEGKDDRALVRALGAGVALLHTLALDDKVHLLLTLPEVLLARQTPIGEAALNTQVQQLRQALQDPRQDPRPAAQALYQALIAPVAADLKAAGVRTLMVSLDGTLRYVPLAVLHDGERYLVERYALSVFTDVARDKLQIAPRADWQGIGLGVSLPHGEVGAIRQRFAALPAVPAELEGIIRRAREDDDGVLPGRYFLDAQFTETTLRKALRTPVLHIASHFSLQPGNESQSFLLLGDGAALELRQIRADNYDFGDIDLLTLSACETAIGGQNARGQEIEGLGTLAQIQGAKGVIATLWPVADASTGRFMQDFYRLRQERRLSKAEALRQAQMILLHGTAETPAASPASATPDSADTAGRGQVIRLGQTDAAPDFVPDPAHPYAHPYYWAPFILMGNWL